VVEDFTLTMPPRAVMAFIGPSGCGNSTVLRTVNRLHELLPGARVKGQVLPDWGIYAPHVGPIWVRRTVGMVFQRPNPFPTMSVRENVVAGLVLRGERQDRSSLDQMVEEMPRLTHLRDEVADRLDDPGAGLSGGRQQRLCIARALAAGPEVLLMDEPCSALDPVSTQAIKDLIARLTHDYTIVVVTHNMAQAARVSDQTAFFNVAKAGGPGRLIEVGDTTAMFTHPTHASTEDYIRGRFG